MSIKIKSSPQLLAFYKWWLENKDKTESLHYRGLCTTAIVDFPEGSPKLKYELGDQFEVAGLDKWYPFGYDNYYDTMHLDPLRIAWVEARIKDMED